jgi:hypothetical protein
VELYVERLNLPETRARIVYQRVLARLAQSLLPRLDETASADDGTGEAGPEPSPGTAPAAAPGPAEAAASASPENASPAAETPAA